MRSHEGGQVPWVIDELFGLVVYDIGSHVVQESAFMGSGEYVIAILNVMNEPTRSRD